MDEASSIRIQGHSSQEALQARSQARALTLTGSSFVGFDSLCLFQTIQSVNLYPRFHLGGIDLVRGLCRPGSVGSAIDRFCDLGPVTSLL